MVEEEEIRPQIRKSANRTPSSNKKSMRIRII